MQDIVREGQRAANEIREKNHQKSTYGSVEWKVGFMDGIDFGASYMMNNTHLWCDCAPELKPPHCHFCSRESETDVNWEDCVVVKTLTDDEEPVFEDQKHEVSEPVTGAEIDFEDLS